MPDRTWRAPLHADRHSALPEHFSHPTRTQPSRPQDADGERLAFYVRRCRQPTCTTHDFSCRLRKPSASTARLLPTGRSSQAETSLPHSFISHYVWADSGWAQRYSDTRQRHGQLGIPLSPLFWRATGYPDIDSLFTPTPLLRGQLRQLQVTLSQQMDTPSLLLKSLGCGPPNTRDTKGLSQYDPTSVTPATDYQSFREQHPESHPHLPNSQKHGSTPTTTQQ